jgi:hypothetical protein
MSILEDQPQMLEYVQAINQEAITLSISAKTLNVQQQ